MRLITFCTVITVWVLSMPFTWAQDTQVTERIEILEATKDRIVDEEKDALKASVEGINQRLENGDITEAEANELKQKMAEKHALNIENRVAIIDNKIELLERNQDMEVLNEDGDRFVIEIGNDGEDDNSFIYIGKQNKARKYDRRTTSDFVFAFGLNNVIVDGELGDDIYKVGGSRFAEFGWAWKTRVFKESNWLRVKYGFSFQFNGLKPTDNRYYVDTGLQTELQTFPSDLDKSKFRLDNLVFPVHFEFGPSKKIDKDTYFRYSTRKKLKVGLGGYAGLKLSSRQKLRYDDMGQEVERKEKGNFNTNNFIYGVSAYLGWGDVGLYAKYDLNTIFKDNPVEQRNISLGLRFDLE
ncbi:MAG: PorT family protein [Bacteroidia bacterium]|nr:PorT family protein [Bacteroidia bacterium]NNF31624.1 hypothetical protein [Flavobacteriaceae bacterium]NNJ83260.1 hypothetical protein [Flavobacteriaceae bacterium]